MNTLDLILVIPVVAALLQIFVRPYAIAAGINVLATVLVFGGSISLFFSRPETTTYFVLDNLNIYLIALTSFVFMTTSIFSVSYIAHEIEIDRIPPKLSRLYHVLFQCFSFTMLMALSSNNLGIMWVSVEGATLASVLLVGLYRTPLAIEAAWKYFILCGVGLALALFGTTLLYLCAQTVIGTGMDAMTWTILLTKISTANPALLNLAFVFLLIGYGTKIGLFPLHAWLPDAHSAAPAPISAVLSGLLLNVAMYVVMRFKMLMNTNPGVIPTGTVMVVFGLMSLFVAGFMLYRRTDIKRLFAFSSIEHMGIITFAFGVGGVYANFAALLHMAMHSLTKSALFFTVGRIAQIEGTQEISKIRGLTTSQPFLGWALVFGTAAIVGLPPSGVFMSEFLVVTSTFSHQPLLVIPLMLGILLGLGALISKMQKMAFGPGEEGKEKVGITTVVPVLIHLTLVLTAGFYLPTFFVGLLQNISKMLG